MARSFAVTGRVDNAVTVRLPNHIFRREVINGRIYEISPMQIYQQATIPAGPLGGTTVFDFSPKADAAGHDLIAHDEDSLVRRAMMFSPIRDELLLHLGFDPASSWCLLGAKRHELLPSNPNGRPGDFDVICGPVRGGVMVFDRLGEIEVKRRAVRGDWSEAQSSSGFGTAQARGAAECGFDVTSLLQFLVGQPRAPESSHASSWAAIHNTEFAQAMERCVGAIRHYDGAENAPYGLMLLGWGHAPGTDAELLGGLCAVPVRAPPDRPLWSRRDVRTRGAEIRERLRRSIGASRPGPAVLAVCRPCRTLHAIQGPCSPRCAS